MTDEILKLCTKCQLSKPLIDFYKKKRTHYTDYTSRCKICTNEDEKMRRETNPRISVEPKIITDYKTAQSAIRELTQEEFDKACEMARNYCPITTLSKFIKCSQPTTKKYIQQGLFGSLK